MWSNRIAVLDGYWEEILGTGYPKKLWLPCFSGSAQGQLGQGFEQTGIVESVLVHGRGME